MLNQQFTRYPAWRLLPIHLIATLFGVRVHVDGLPFGAHRGRACEEVLTDSSSSI